MMTNVIGSLEVLGYDQIRGVIGEAGPAGDKIQALIPGTNSVVVVHVRFKDGQPFSMTVDGETFEKEFLPAFKARESASVSPS